MMFPANRINRPPEWKDYTEAARRMVAAGVDIETSSLEECQQILADVQAAYDRDPMRDPSREESSDLRLALPN